VKALIDISGNPDAKKYILNLFFPIILLFAIVSFSQYLLYFQTAFVVYVSGDGSGDYNCDGTDDHVQIQQALEYAASNHGTTVYLKGPFT